LLRTGGQTRWPAAQQRWAALHDRLGRDQAFELALDED
jgi:hypothetical protein